MFYKNTYRLKLRGKAILLIVFCFSQYKLYSQEATTGKTRISPIEIQVFTNIGILTSAADSIVNPAFDMKRTLLVLRHDITDRFNICLAGDSYARDPGKPFGRTLYIKRAYLNYSDESISVTAGLLVLEQFKLQRKIWGLRYMDKTFQNKSGYGDNRNIGISVKHKINNKFSYDLAFTSGYNTPEKLSTENQLFMAGQTFSSDFCTLRLFNSFVFSRDYEHVLSLFASKEIEQLNISFEAARKFSKSTPGTDKYGFSVYANYTFNEKLMLFTRYDRNKYSAAEEQKNIYWLGLEYSINKYLRTVVYYRDENHVSPYFGMAMFFHYL